MDTHKDALNLGICLQKPYCTSYTTMASRVKSFQSWTKTSPRPVDLAEAGFFFTGTEDIVQCFYCGLKLRQWDVFDSPWVEHARHGKNCPHVLNVKGKEYYKRNEIDEDGSSGVVTRNTSQPRTNLYSDDLIYTTAGQALLNMKYTKEEIQNAIKVYVMTKDTIEFSAVDIATIIQPQT